MFWLKFALYCRETVGPLEFLVFLAVVDRRTHERVKNCFHAERGTRTGGRVVVHDGVYWGAENRPGRGTWRSSMRYSRSMAVAAALDHPRVLVTSRPRGEVPGQRHSRVSSPGLGAERGAEKSHFEQRLVRGIHRRGCYSPQRCRRPARARNAADTCHPRPLLRQQGATTCVWF